MLQYSAAFRTGGRLLELFKLLDERFGERTLAALQAGDFQSRPMQFQDMGIAGTGMQAVNILGDQSAQASGLFPRSQSEMTGVRCRPDKLPVSGRSRPAAISTTRLLGIESREFRSLC